jgi:hypothetical protein
MQPLLSPGTLSQLETFVTSDRTIHMVAEDAVQSYLQYQTWMQSFAPAITVDTAELQQKFNHLLAQTRQSEADLRGLIKDVNVRLAQQGIWTDGQFDLIRQTIKDSKAPPVQQFSLVEQEVLQRFARSMGAADNLSAESTQPTLPPESPIVLDNSPARTKIDIAKMSRSDLAPLMKANGFPSRNPQGKAWNREEMRAELLARGGNLKTQASNKTKKRGRPAKKTIAAIT